MKIIISIIAGFSFQSAWADHHFALFMVVKGDVAIYSAKSNKQKASVGLQAFEGDRIVVGPDSSAKLVTLDRNVLVVGEKSEITIEKYQFVDSKNKNVSIKLRSGRIRSALRQKYDQKSESYHISTPTSVTGVRGTDFYVEYDEVNNENVICTFSGKVSYKPNDSKMGYTVDAGRFVRHKQGQEVKVSDPKAAWIEKTMKALEVSGKEELPEGPKVKSVK